MYHFRAKIVSRGKGGGGSAASALAYRAGGRAIAATLSYRAGAKIRDSATGQVFDYSAKGQLDKDGFGVLHSEMMLPHAAPMWMYDLQAFADAIEAAEKRKDAQLARELEISLPRELTFDQQLALVRTFVATACVSQGMAAHIAIHDERASDGGRNPHAHVLLALRQVTPGGFGLKERAWNRKALVQEWRETWADMANEALDAAGHERRIDHRSHAARDIELLPDIYLGPKARYDFSGIMADARAEQRQDIKLHNLDAILDDPRIALNAITREKATFTLQDIERQIQRATGLSKDDTDFATLTAHVAASPYLVAVAMDHKGAQRFTTREMLDVETDMARAAQRLAARGHSNHPPDDAIFRGLSDEQQAACRHVLQGGDLSIISGVAGAGKTTMLRALVEALQAEGRQVRGAALAGIAAKNLRDEANIPASTLHGLFYGWDRVDHDGRHAPRDPLRQDEVVILDEAGMVESRMMRRLLVEAERAGARVLLVGDSAQLQAIGAGAAFRALSDTHGAAKLTDVHRQGQDWMRQATKDFARGETGKALEAYRANGAVHSAGTTELAMDALIAAWVKDRDQTRSQLILSYFTADVDALNDKARAALRTRGELGPDVRVQVQKQQRDEAGNLLQHAAYRNFADGDRILFLQNDKKLDVQNGARGSVEAVTEKGDFRVRLDDGRRVEFSAADYGAITQGYASTIHKAQGATVDRAYVLANNRFDSNLAYVAMSRHRHDAILFYGADQFETPDQLNKVLARRRPKDSTLDYMRRPERARGSAGQHNAAPQTRRDQLQPQLKPSPTFIAQHGGETARPATPKTALDIVRANAAKQRERQRPLTRERGLDD